MKDGAASHTARRVAAHRLAYDRVPADYGDPAADLALSRDVAAGLEPAPGRIHDRLRRRTAFFDRVVVTAVTGGISQVVVGAAGYDGRSLRYAKPGARWFEVDHPATQADKLERLRRLAIDTSHVTFVAADFAADPVAAALREAGLDTAEPALFLFEGIAIYLDRLVNESVLAQFREVTVPGATLAISLSLTTTTSGAGERDRFAERVAALGEPARCVLEPAEATALLARAGWEAAEPGRPHSPSQAAGLLTARARPGHFPAERPLVPPPPPAASDSAAAGGPAGPGTSPRPRPEAVSADGRPGEHVLPLHALLSRALVAFTIEADNEAEHRLPHRTSAGGLAPGAAAGAPWLISLAMWASSLRHIPDAGITVAGLHQAARTRTNLAGIRRWGYVTFDPEPARGKQPAGHALIRLTAAGRAARDGWAPIGAVVEQRWRDRFGARVMTELRAALETVAGRVGPGLPDCLPILGYGLFSRPDSSAAGAGGTSAGGSRARDEPRERDAARTVAGLELWALLSRVLLAFAVDYESQSPLSLAISANALRVLTPGGVRLRSIPVLAGVSKESVAMALGILAKQVLATEVPDPGGARWRVAHLTERGERALTAYHALAASIEDAWQERFGPEAITRLRAALEQFPLEALLERADPYPEGWRARVRPLAELPHYPMVLHRGGYPDGS